MRPYYNRIVATIRGHNTAHLLSKNVCSTLEPCFAGPVAVVVTRPLSRDGGMAEDHGAPEAEQLPRL